MEGVTAIIDASGRVVASAPEFATTTLSGEVRGYQGSTPYIVFGNTGFLVLALSMLLIPLVIVHAVRVR